MAVTVEELSERAVHRELHRRAALAVAAWLALVIASSSAIEIPVRVVKSTACHAVLC